MASISPPKAIGVREGIFAALMFGASTPLAKLFVGDINPWVMSGLLFVGSGGGLYLGRVLRGQWRLAIPTVNRSSLYWAILCGGIIAPVLLMYGLATMSASDASLMINTETVFTAGIAWLVFKEHIDRNLALGLVVIVAGGIVLSFGGSGWQSALLPTFAVIGACLLWGLDNNLTRRVADGDAVSIASLKGLISGPTSLALGFLTGAQLPTVTGIAGMIAIGYVCYGLSFVLFIHALRHLGSARTGTYFAVAPFFGAVLAVILGAPVTGQLVVAGLLMAIGVVITLPRRSKN